LNLTQALPTLAVAIPPNYDQEPNVFAGYNGGLLRSLDAGRNWENIPFPSPSPAIVALVTSPNYAQDGCLIAGTLEDGVFYSSDRGAHWKTGQIGLIDLKLFCLGISPGFENDRTIFAGTQSGLFRSHNAGRSWREVDLPIGYEAVISLALSPNFAQDGTLFAGTETQGLLYSTDRGNRWERMGQPILSEAINQILLSPEFPREPHLLVLHDGKIFISDNGGRSWQPWKEALLENKNATALLAPLGFRPGAPVWIGFEGGDTLKTIC